MAVVSLKDCVAVLQAGGKGTRMLPLTHDKIPKPLLKLGGKPMLEWQVLNLKKYGVREFVIIVGHLGEMIEEYFGDGGRWEVNISFIKEETPLGSGGALSYLQGKFLGKHIILTLGDVMFDMDMPRLIAFHENKKALATLVVHPNSHPHDSDLVVLDENDCVTKFDAKTNVRDYFYDNCVNAGVYVIEPEVLSGLHEARKRDLEKEILLPLLEKRKLYGYRTTEYLKDAGTVERFRAVEKELAEGLWERRNLERPQCCVFLDRDGTLNRYKGLIASSEQIELEDYAAEAVRLLNASGYLAIVVTNQPVVARGMCTVDDVREMHFKMGMLLGEKGAYLDGIMFCPHHPDKGYPGENLDYKIVCECRKPKTGMIDALAEKYNIDRSRSWLIGDTTSDIECGCRAGLKTVLIKTGEAGRDGKYEAKPDGMADDILSAVSMIVEKEGAFVKDYKEKLRHYMDLEKRAYDSLSLEEINEVMNVLENARTSGKRIFICGNGGSSATASHFVCDFDKGVSHDREQRERYNFICLSDNVPTMMAIANDISYDEVFRIPLMNKLHSGDVVIGISGSGNSENVVRALDYANAHGGITVAITGYDGGKMKKMAKHNIHVPIDNMQIAEDLHMMLDHMMMWALGQA